MSEPLAYFITFTCYGTWIHGDGRGSVDRTHHEPGTPFLPADPRRLGRERARLRVEPYYLDAVRRQKVLRAITEISKEKGWQLWAAHVRTNHVHIVVTADGPVERVMNDIKACASRRLNKAFPDEGDRPRWTRHGSTLYLWTDAAVTEKVDYILERQGVPLARYPDPSELDPSEPRTQAAQRPE